MATADARFEHVGRPTKAPTPYAVEGDRGILQRWRERNAQHKRARLVSARNRRRLVRWLRRTARDANERRIRPGPEVLLHYRTAACGPTCSRSPPCSNERMTPIPTA